MPTTPLGTAEYDPAGEFSGTDHSDHELVVDGGPNGGHTCSRVSHGTVSMDHSDKHTSVELCEGYFANRRPQSKKFEVKCTNVGSLEGDQSCSRIVGDNPPEVNHASTTGSWTCCGDSLTRPCHEGYMYAKTWRGGVLPDLLQENGHFSGQAACTPIECDMQTLNNVYLHSQGGLTLNSGSYLPTPRSVTLIT